MENQQNISIASVDVDITRLEFLSQSELIEGYGILLQEIPLLQQTDLNRALYSFRYAFEHLKKIDFYSEKLRLVESIRPLILQLGEQLTELFLNAPLPLIERSSRLFDHLFSLHRSTIEAYASLLTNIDYTHLHFVIVHQRLLSQMREIAIFHFMAHRDLPDNFWQDVHRIFRRVEKQRFETAKVDEITYNTLTQITCLETYISCLLIDIASPYNQEAEDLQIIIAFAQKWAGMVTLQRFPYQGIVPAQIIDLSSDSPLVSFVNQEIEPSFRIIDTTPLKRSMQLLQNQISQGLDPVTLAINNSDNLSLSKLSSVLERLTIPWTQLMVTRKFKRYADRDSICRVTSSLLDIHGVLSFFQDHEAATESELFDCEENWRVINHSAQGFCIAKELQGKQISHSDLLLVKHESSDQPLLCCVAWLLQVHDNRLLLGVSFLPGVPSPCVLFIEDGEYSGSWCAFMMQAVSSLDQHNTLILPSSMRREIKQCFIQHGNHEQSVQIDEEIDSRADYRRVRFTIL